MTDLVTRRHNTPGGSVEGGFVTQRKEKIIYAMDMYSVNNSPPVGLLGVTPVWAMADSQENSWSVYADLKDPIDRIPGTPIDLKMVYAMTVSGNADVALFINTRVTGDGQDVTVAPLAAWLIDTTPGVNILKTTNTIVQVLASRLDGLSHAQISMAIGRDPLQTEDRHPGTLNLIKVIAEYYGYT